MLNSLRKPLVFILTVTAVCVGAQKAPADVSLSVTPVTGGTSLRLGRVDVKESSSQEVRLRVTATEGQQYQVYQRMEDSLINERGESLDVEALQSYVLSGSNSQGTLYNQDLQGVTLSDNLIYTSDSSGTSDGFTIIYQMNQDRVNATGNFTGRIAYIVRPIGGAAQSEAVLTVYLEIPDEFSITSKASSGLDVIRLEAGPNGSGYFQIRFVNNTGRTISIYQDLAQMPQNEQFEDLDRQVIQLKAGVSGGGENFFSDFTPQPLGRKLVARSDQESEDLMLEYRLDEEAVSRQKSGTYRAQVNYVIETDQADPKILTAQFEVEIPPVFQLETVFPGGPIHFSQILPDSPPQLQEVQVKVKSNLGRPYMVMQKVSAPLTNDQGATMDNKLFTIKQEIIDGGGRIVNSDFEAVTVGDAPVFLSDTTGAPTQFRIIYRLSPNPQIKAGDYSTGIMLSLGEV